jgi:hypothetical protein
MAERPVAVSVKESVKAALLDLLREDPDVRAALRALLGEAAPATLEVREPDAEMGTWVIDLIKEKMRQHIRDDAFRVRP